MNQPQPKQEHRIKTFRPYVLLGIGIGMLFFNQTVVMGGFVIGFALVSLK